MGSARLNRELIMFHGGLRYNIENLLYREIEAAGALGDAILDSPFAPRGGHAWRTRFGPLRTS